MRYIYMKTVSIKGLVFCPVHKLLHQQQPRDGIQLLARSAPPRLDVFSESIDRYKFEDHMAEDAGPAVEQAFACFFQSGHWRMGRKAGFVVD